MVFRRTRSSLGILALASIAGCTGHVEEQLNTELDELAQGPWQVLGTGVAYQAVPGGGRDVLLVYGGYSALDEYSRGWATELVRSAGGTYGVGHVYAVRGPNDPGYDNREIHNRKLLQHLVGQGIASAASKLVIVAHSSGTYVSSELLTMMASGDHGALVEKTELFELDGGGLPASTIVRRLAHAYFVLACDPQIGRCSRNAEAMRALGRTWASIGGAIEVDATGSGCNRTSSGGLWCLHDTVINTRPHNPNGYDLRRDYTDFSGRGRAVVTSYLRELLPAGLEPANVAVE